MNSKTNKNETIKNTLNIATRLNEAREQLLFELRDMDLNAQDDFGWTALMTAALRGERDIVALLLKAGADPYIENDANETALHLAIEAYHTLLVRDMVEAYVNPNRLNRDGNSALDIAQYHYPDDAFLTKTLKEYGGKLTGKMTPMEKGDIAMAEEYASLTFIPSTASYEEIPILEKLDAFKKTLPGCGQIAGCTTCGGILPQTERNMTGELESEIKSFLKDTTSEEFAKLGSWKTILESLYPELSPN